MNGIIQWDAGGGTDSLMRSLSVLAQDILSTNIVLTNKSGETGSVATQYVYDQEADGSCLLMGAENPALYDTLSKVQMGYQEYKSGDYKWLCMLATEPVERMSDVPLITEEYPEFKDYLPWGPFYGVFVKAGTDEKVVQILLDAFARAYEDSSYQTMLGYFYINPLGYTGEEATEYIAKWRANMTDILTKAGAIS